MNSRATDSGATGSRTTVTVIMLLVLVTYCVPVQGDSFSERRERLENMSAADREELKSKQARFEKLVPAEQEKLRKIESTLREDPKGEQLREVMIRYQDWLRSLPSSRRVEVLRAPPEERVKKIKTMLAEQEEQRRTELAIQVLSKEDTETVRAWMRDIMKRAEPELLASLSAEQRKEYNQSEELRGRFFMMVEAASRKRGIEKDPFKFEILMNITEEDRQQLVSRLSPAAQTAYRQAKDEHERRRLVQSWNRAAAYREKFHVSPDDLRKFLERADQRTRERLENLPHDQMRAEIEMLIRMERTRMMGDWSGGYSGKRRTGERKPFEKKTSEPEPEK